jgi:hypothetical protein
MLFLFVILIYVANFNHYLKLSNLLLSGIEDIITFIIIFGRMKILLSAFDIINMKNILLALLTLYLVSSQTDLYNLVLHSKERGAACLDGSPPGLYIHEGTGANKNKFMMYFDSGGFCGAGSLA